jgi:hypothetical protein
MQTGGAVLCIVERGNIDRLREGKPMTIDLTAHPGAKEVLIFYTPDLPFVQQALTSLMSASGRISAEQLGRVIEEASKRSEVVR